MDFEDFLRKLDSDGGWSNDGKTDKAEKKEYTVDELIDDLEHVQAYAILKDDKKMATLIGITIMTVKVCDNWRQK